MRQTIIDQHGDVLIALKAGPIQCHLQDNAGIGNAAIIIENKISQAVGDQTSMVRLDGFQLVRV